MTTTNLTWTTPAQLDALLKQAQESHSLMILNCHNLETMHCHLIFPSGEKIEVLPKRTMSQSQWVAHVVNTILRSWMLSSGCVALIAVSNIDYGLFDRQFAKQGVPKRRGN